MECISPAQHEAVPPPLLSFHELRQDAGMWHLEGRVGDGDREGRGGEGRGGEGRAGEGKGGEGKGGEGKGGEGKGGEGKEGEGSEGRDVEERGEMKHCTYIYT